MEPDARLPTDDAVGTWGNIAPCPDAPVNPEVVVDGPTQQQVQGPQPQPEAANARKRKPMHKRSVVWEHYESVNDDMGRVVSAKCLYCARVYECHSKRNGTSTLRAHMLACLKNPNSKHTRQALLTMPNVQHVNDGNLVNVGVWKFSQEAVRESLAFMIVVDELPLRFVDGMGFRKLMNTACPRFKIPSRWTMNRDIFNLFASEKLKLKSFLKDHSQRVSITTDTWTSIQRINYMCVTCHWIDDSWKLHKAIISFIPVSGHRGEYIAKSLENCVLDWGVKNVFSITMDNASSNDVAVGVFRKKLISWGTGVAKGKYLHMRCIAHILNLVVSDGLKDVNVSVKKVRDAVRYIRNSPARLKKFKESADFVGVESKKCLCLDVPTRWNSTYLMLHTAALYEKVFEKYDEDESSFKTDLNGNIPDSHDWEVVRKFSDCLAHFYTVTLRISGSLYVTSDMHFQEICDLNVVLCDMIESDDLEIKNLGERMKVKFDKYWGDPDKMNKLIFFAYVFDPSVKLEGMEYSLTTMFGKVRGVALYKAVVDELTLLFLEYNSIFESVGGGSSSNVSELGSQPSSTQVEGGNLAPVPVPYCATGTRKPPSVMKARFKQHRREMGTSSSRRTELEIYLDEALLDDEDQIDVLMWWKFNSARFPVLSRMARDILAVPISTVASESAFSTGGRVLDCFRSSLTPKLVEALICTQNWLRASIEPLVVEECIEELETFEQGLPNVGPPV
ncbi:zinc finger BED domain-containing protein RICESLEEPER 2-like [Mercurialis annua]|uniref:zinc finger BED domain-containing protein RICESLEEPER 2-like n=1 Tax=Mercurialis annua TaxID=3986 RepID=UPI00215FDAD5|nr:zinc finger BED domain-containing protein RICESLEEPER 2-like [Mercurialis annua]XP_055961648.1 zinc finger BED domain-containing protein RICESLEEPER 2-like [Mercurialis annua]